MQTATCCHKCLYKWHSIPMGTDLNQEQVEYIVDIIMEWFKEKKEGIKIDESYLSY